MAQNPKKKQDKENIKLIELQNRVDELTEALQRERADATNVRRRAEEEKTAMGTYYKAMVVRDLLPVIDNFERAINHQPKPDSGKSLEEWIHGVDKIYKQFGQSLVSLGVSPIGVVGEPFDPRLHEAVQMEEGDGHQEVVSEVLQTGYKLGDEVIRHAMVKVAMR